MALTFYPVQIESPVSESSFVSVSSSSGSYSSDELASYASSSFSNVSMFEESVKIVLSSIGSAILASISMDSAIDQRTCIHIYVCMHVSMYVSCMTIPVQ